MRYSELLSSYIEMSGLSLGDIALRLRNRGIKVDRSYISKLKTGNRSAASEEVTRALAEVTGGDPQDLLLAGYIEKAPTEVRAILEESKVENEAQTLIKMANKFLRYYLDTKEVNEDILNGLHAAAITFKDITIDFDFFRRDPVTASSQLFEKALLKMAHFYGDPSYYPSDKVRDGTGLRSIRELRDEEKHNVSEPEYALLRKLREVAKERDMDLTDSRFMGMIVAAMDFARRITEEDQG